MAVGLELLKITDGDTDNTNAPAASSAKFTSDGELRKTARRVKRLAEQILEGVPFEQLSPDYQHILVTNLASIETVLKGCRAGDKPKRPKRVAAVLGQLSEEHTRVLEWINQHRFATTSQVRDYLVVVGATDVLRELERVGLVDSNRFELHRGRQSEKVYWLSSRGAAYLNNHGLSPSARCESRFASRPPDSDMVYFRTMEYELLKQSALAGWQVVEPQVFNSANPKGDGQTRQATILANAVHNIEQAQIEEARHNPNTKPKELAERIASFKLDKHLLDVPRQCNEYVTYLPNTNIVLVFILCPLEISQAFWQTRIGEYAPLARRVPVFGLFWRKEQATSWQSEIDAGNIGSIFLANLPEVFEDYKPD